MPGRPAPRAIPSCRSEARRWPDCHLLQGSAVARGGGAGGTGRGSGGGHEPAFPALGAPLWQAVLAPELSRVGQAFARPASCFDFCPVLLPPFPWHVLIPNKHLVPHTPSQLLLQNSACRKGPGFSAGQWCPVAEGVSTLICSIGTLLP